MEQDAAKLVDIVHGERTDYGQSSPTMEPGVRR